MAGVSSLNLEYITAPMVNQSDLPFRILTRKYGATLAYTQMLMPDKLLNDQEYLEYHQRDLSVPTAQGLERPVVVQLCGNDPQIIVNAGRRLQSYCDAIGVLMTVIYNQNTALMLICGKLIRPEPRVPSRTRASGTFRRLFAWSKGLATRREHRYLPSCYHCSIYSHLNVFNVDSIRNVKIVHGPSLAENSTMSGCVQNNRVGQAD